MLRQFHKMHGLGNDFVILDAREQPLEMTGALARHIAERREGIGCDQLILLEPSASADLRMRIFNADGSEVQSCGNGANFRVHACRENDSLSAALGDDAGREDNIQSVARAGFLVEHFLRILSRGDTLSSQQGLVGLKVDRLGDPGICRDGCFR